MRIFDLVGGIRGQRAGHRVAVIGTCRVYGAFEALEKSGRVIPVWTNVGTITHTLAEAGQIIRYTRGELDIADPIRAFIFQADPLRTPADARILDTVDTIFLEVSEWWQISHVPYHFNGNRFYENFVSKYGAPLLPWYRALAAGRIDDDIVASVMMQFADRSAEEREWLQTILSRTRMDFLQHDDDAAAVLDGVMFDRRKQWVLVSQFLVPGIGGTHLRDRTRINDIVHEITTRSGLDAYNPSELVARHGRKTALASGGRDVYHYHPDFYEIVADGMLGAAGLIGDSGVAPVSAIGEAAPADDPSLPAKRINDSLLRVHERRLVLGVNESGLYAHYKTLLDAKSIAGQDVADLASLIANDLPRFDRYHVLRAGLGELAFVLASFGLHVTGYDQNERRFNAMSAGLERLYDDYPEIAQCVTIGRAGIPMIPKQGRTLAVATHLIGYDPEAQDEVLADLSAYSALLIRPGEFLFDRNSEAEQDDLLTRLRSVGFEEIRRVATGLAYCARPVADG